MKKLILSAVVAAAAIFGAYTANQTNEVASLGLLDATDIEAEGTPTGDGDRNVTIIKSEMDIKLHGPYDKEKLLTSCISSETGYNGENYTVEVKVYHVDCLGQTKIFTDRT